MRTASLVRPPATVAARLRVPDGESVVYVERLRSLGGLPLSLDLTYLVRDIGEPLLAEDLAGTDIFSLIERVSGQGLGTAPTATGGGQRRRALGRPAADTARARRC